ncbi:hypothetical protein DL770_010643 [Monosporascus sp. CRB-9-2]|nr:hypothetical protein DL770_010643 [Monosporascus sp. CRB-9-2]
MEGLGGGMVTSLSDESLPRTRARRDLTIWKSFSVSFSVLGLLPSVAAPINYGLACFGTAGAVWGWLTASLYIRRAGPVMFALSIGTQFSVGEGCTITATPAVFAL